MIPVLIASLGTVSKNVGKKFNELEVRGRIEIILTIALPKSNKMCIEGNKFTKSLEKINSLLYLDDIKRFAKNKKKANNIYTNY